MKNLHSTHSTTTITNEENLQEYLGVAKMIETVVFYLKKIEKSKSQLLIIERNNEDTSIGDQAEVYLRKQNKVLQVATELKSRMIAHLMNRAINKELQEQFAQEVDVLNWMHFEVTKTFFSFINQNFEARVITLSRPKAA